MANDATFITRLDTHGDGPTLAVKDLIDVAGVPTTAGSLAVAEHAMPAAADAPLLAGARRPVVRGIVGKANLHELAFGAAGVNEHYGTPVNPLDVSRVPGGSSSGSAVAVTSGDADLALGSDTGGSIRVPSAFCGITGLKTTWGRVPLQGVWPLSPSLDTVGPMARDVDGVIATMALLEPGFAATSPAGHLGRVRPEGVAVDPVIDVAIDALLALLGLTVTEIAVPTWSDAYRAGVDLLVSEAAEVNAPLLDDPDRSEKLSAAVRDRLLSARRVDGARLEAARGGRARFLGELAPLFRQVELLALPSVGFFPPPLAEAYTHNYTLLTMPVNLAGLPALSLPVPTPGPFPASLQLVGPAGSEELLVATGKLVEAAARS